MKRCFPFYIFKTDVIKDDGKKEASWEFADIDRDTAGEVADFLQKYYPYPYETFPGMVSDRLFDSMKSLYKKRGVWPWAVVLFNEEFRLAGHVASIRKDKKDFLFSAYSINTGNYSVAEMGVPSVSHFYVYRKGAIEQAATQSELFRAAWEQLADLPEDQHWICIADSPSEEWVKQTSQDDDQLFMKMTGA